MSSRTSQSLFFDLAAYSGNCRFLNVRVRRKIYCKNSVIAPHNPRFPAASSHVLTTVCMTLPRPAELGPDHDGASSLMIRLAFIEPFDPGSRFCYTFRTVHYRGVTRCNRREIMRKKTGKRQRLEPRRPLARRPRIRYASRSQNHRSLHSQPFQQTLQWGRC